MVLQTTTAMSGTTDVRSAERQNLLTRLLDAVKQCQVRFGGRSELATEADSRVSCLCAAWEAALQHGMKHSNKALSTFKQVTEMTGLTKLASGISVVDNVRNMETEPAFWQYVKEHLNKHEIQRFLLLKNIDTDAGRGRAWLRSTFNEHSLEKYTHMLLENETFLCQYYEEWALVRDMERSSMMPMMAAGLGSILFAIGIDNPELNTIKPASGLDVILSNPTPLYAPRTDVEPMPVIAGESHANSPQERRKLHKKKKKIAHIVSFDEEEGISSSPGSSITSPSAASTRSFDLGLHPVRSGGRKKEGFPLGGQVSASGLTVGSLPSHGFTTKSSETGKTHMRNSSLGSLEYMKRTEGATLPRQASTGSLPNQSTQSQLSENPTAVPSISPTNSSVSSSQDYALDSKGGAIQKQTSSDSAKSDSLWSTPREKQDSRKVYAFSSGYATQSSDSSQDLPVGGAGIDKQTDIVLTSDTLPGESSTAHKMQTEMVPMARTDTVDVPKLDTGAIVSELLATNEPAAQLVPISPDGALLDPFMAVKPASGDDSISNDSVPSYNEDLDNATYALSLAQKGLSSTQRERRTQGDGSYAPEPSSTSLNYDSMSTEDLRQAIITMMLRKDEIEENNKWLRCALEVEQDTVNAQKLHIEDMSKQHEAVHEKESNTIKAITKENDLLKHQLRKYVSAVQMLRSQAGKTDGGELQGIHLDDTLQPTVPPQTSSIDYSHEASEYERKLIQVAEMHGELMEFSDMLHRQLNAREALLKLYKQELIELRGPLPEDLQGDDRGSVRFEDFDISPPRERSLISVWIPSAFLRGTGSDAYHVYQVYLRIRDEEWNIYRRYTDFLDLHNKIRKIYPVIGSYQFPPKKAIGNKDARFVEGRRKRLQDYIRQAINYLTQNHAHFNGEVNRATLVQIIPFFGDQPKAKPAKSKSSKKEKKASSKTAASDNSAAAAPNTHYMGL